MILDFIAKINPFRKLANTKKRQKIEQILNKKEQRTLRMEAAVIEKKNHLIETAERLDRTVKLAIEEYKTFEANHK